jgi:uncharacterized protein (DUF302 family)
MRRAFFARSAMPVVVAALVGSATVVAQTGASPPGTHTLRSASSFEALLAQLEKAVQTNQMVVVAQASASRGAAARGVTIPGNAVVMVFRNDYAVRMLAASVPAGIEAPLRFYITENPDRTASLTWRAPTAVFAPYGSAALDAMASELDPIFAKIAGEAAGG